MAHLAACLRGLYVSSWRRHRGDGTAPPLLAASRHWQADPADRQTWQWRLQWCCLPAPVIPAPPDRRVRWAVRTPASWRPPDWSGSLATTGYTSGGGGGETRLSGDVEWDGAVEWVDVGSGYGLVVRMPCLTSKAREPYVALDFHTTNVFVLFDASSRDSM